MSRKTIYKIKILQKVIKYVKMYTSQTKEYGIFLKVKKYILLRKEIGQFS